ncbi:hypothetical protein VTJ83DRAFT_392 [Remersonia thermophila]|uniref:alpha-1,2-Mannosidase n=1 Tax=Remersonia thermophila TaxID=72144 RepID=A0ABR4DKV0_9PEZI
MDRCSPLAAADGSSWVMLEHGRPAVKAAAATTTMMPPSGRPRCWHRLGRLLLLLPWTLLYALALMLGPSGWPTVVAMHPNLVRDLRRETVEMFYHGFDNYMKIAFPEDELRPVSCSPLTRDAHNPQNVELNDVLGNYSLTLIDSLSTLAILASAPPEDGDTAERALNDFQNGVAALVEQYGDGTAGPSGQGLRGRGFDVDSKVQVFETVIRGVGGLLSAHLFALGALPIAGYDPRRHAGDDLLNPAPIPWPNGFTYDGQLLRLALDLAERLLPAFYTKTGMPYPRVNLRHGIPFYVNSPLHQEAAAGSGAPPRAADGSPEITETCSAGAGSLVLEFTVLSRLTGDPRFEQLAKRAFWAVWYRKSQIGLIGAGVDAEQGHWIGPYSVIGAGADSFFEYALKSHILLSGHDLPDRTVVAPPPASQRARPWLDPNTLFPPLTDDENSPGAFLEVWHQAHAAIKRHLYTDRDHPHYENVNLWTGSLASYWVDSLGAYYSGLLVLAGEVDEAVATNLLYAAIWTRYAALPERWSLREKTVEGGLGWWPLRPEFIESTYHLYRATKDPWYLYVGEMVLRDISRRCRTRCGWAGLQNVLDGQKSDRMESFFLGETTKYMYLLFDDRHPLNSLDAAYVFTTEGHPLILPKPKTAASGKGRSKQKQDVTVYHDEALTNACPPRPASTPLSGSVVAARDDIYHAARMLDLHLLSSSSSSSSSRLSGDKGQNSGLHMARSNFTLFPWTLPPELLPANGTCAKVYHPLEMLLEFSVTDQAQAAGSAFNFLLNNQNLERLATDRVRVTSLSGLKLTLRLDEDGGEREWRVSKVNGVPLGRDELVVFDRSLLGDIADPRFRLVRDPVVVKLQHLHQVDLLAAENAAASLLSNAAAAADAAVGADGDDTPPDHDSDDPNASTATATAADKNNHNNNNDDENDTPSPYNDLTSLVKSIFHRITASLDNIQLPTALPGLGGGGGGGGSGSSNPPKLSLPYNLVINQTAVTAIGVGAAPLPEDSSSSSSGSKGQQQQQQHIPAFGPVPAHLLPWTTVYPAGLACSAPLPASAPRDHHVILMRRGGCSFAAKLANIPAFAPSSRSLRLVVVVSDDDEREHEREHDGARDRDEEQNQDRERKRDQAEGGAAGEAAGEAGMVRPLLDEVQRTPGGIARRHPIAMVLTGGGEAAYRRIAAAKRVGLARRWWVESEGVRVGNLLVDEGGEGDDW